MNTKLIESEALRMAPEDRARLALELIQSLEDIPSSELEAMWLAEAGRRAAQLDAGVAELIPGDVVAQQARALLKQ
jgi:hypothetical protein